MNGLLGFRAFTLGALIATAAAPVLSATSVPAAAPLPAATTAAATARTATAPDILSALSAAASKPGDARARLVLGHAYSARGSLIEAWGAYQEVIAIAAPGSPERTEAERALAGLQRQAARVHAAAGDDAGARRWMNAAQQLDGQNASPALPATHPGATAALARARAALDAHRPAAALDAIASYPGPRSPSLIAWQAEAWLQAGQDTRAERALARARYFAPSDSRVLRVASLLLASKAQALAARGSSAEALKLLMPLETNSAAPEALVSRARLRRSAGDTRGAIADYEAAVLAPGMAPLVHAELARLYLANGQLADLVLRYPHAAPGDTAAWLAEARRQQAAGRREPALAAWARVVGLDPANAEAWGEAARLRLEAGDTARALINLRESLKRGRGDLLALFVETLASAGRAREAELEIAKALHSPRRPARPVLEALSLAAARHSLASSSRLLAAVLQPAPSPDPVSARARAGEATSPAPPPSPTPPPSPASSPAPAAPSVPASPPVPEVDKTRRGKHATEAIRSRQDTVAHTPASPGTVAVSAPRTPPPSSSAPGPELLSRGRTSGEPDATFPTATVTPPAAPGPVASHPQGREAQTLSDSQARALAEQRRALLARADTLGAARLLARMVAGGMEVPRLDLGTSATAARRAGDAGLVIALLAAPRFAGTWTPEEAEMLGDAYGMQGNTTRALALWERAAASPRPGLLLKIAGAFQERGEIVRARQVLERAESLATSNDQAEAVTLAQGRLLLDEGNPLGAATLLEPIKQSVNVSPWYSLALVRSGRNAQAAALGLPSTAPGLPSYARAELAAARGDSSGALTLFQASPPPVTATPAWKTWIDLLARRSQWAAASEACNGLYARPGGAPLAAILRARIANHRGDQAAARTWARLAVRLAPASVEVRLEAATVLWRSGRSAEAAAVLAPVVRTLPAGLARARVLAASGTALLGVGLVEQAATQLTEARALALAHADNRLADAVAYNLALAERRRGEPGRALTILDESGRNDLSARLVRASALIDLERTSEAIAILEAAATASPIATLNYGILLRLNGLPTDSVRVLRYLAEIWTGDALVHFHLAASLEAAGSTSDARASYLAAAENERDTDLGALFRRQAARLLSPSEATSHATQN